MAPVFFYEHEFYPFSNFSSFTLRWKGQEFMTSEHVYHFEKFSHYPPQQEEIRRAKSAHEALMLSRKYKSLIRLDWDKVKVGIMKEILREKALQHSYVMKKLIDSGERELIENSWRDDFWGWGANKDGQNQLGKLWMEIRKELSPFRVFLCLHAPAKDLKTWINDHLFGGIGFRVLEKDADIGENSDHVARIVVIAEKQTGERYKVWSIYEDRTSRTWEPLYETMRSRTLEKLYLEDWRDDTPSTPPKDFSLNDLPLITDIRGKQYSFSSMME